MKFLAKWRVRKPSHDADTAYVSERYGVRTLHIGSDTVQSAMRIARPHDLELSYTRSMMAFLLFTANPQHVLLIGLGGGSVAKYVHRHMPASRVTVVELKPQVVAIARHYFHVPPDGPNFDIVVGDGAQYVARSDVSTDVLAVDGYVADTHAEELTSADFYAACRARLRPGGLFVVNLWGGDKLFTSLLRRIENAFPAGTLCLPAERPGNVIVLGFRDRPAPFAWRELQERAHTLEKRYDLEFTRFVEAFRKMNQHDDEHLFT